MIGTRQLVALTILAMGCRRPPEAPVYRTTDGAITVGNIDSQIDSWEHILKVLRPNSVQAMAGLVDLHQTKAQYFGKLGGFDRATELGELAVRTEPGSAEARLLRAGNRAALHRFSEASRDLAEAEKLGANPREVRSLRASIFQAQGKIEEALALRRALARESPNVFTLGALAAAETDPAAAAREYEQAIKVYRDTSPLPLAWIEFQRGLAAERAGQLELSLQHYLAATGRLPQYAQAQGHLAAVRALLGDKGAAEQILRQLVSTTDDPEFAGQLAALTGDLAMRERASARYEDLLAKYPQAFADHAARFYLAFQPARALSLAQLNLQARQTLEAYDLALSAAALSGDEKAGCALAAAAVFPGSHRIEALVARACPSGKALAQH